MQDSCLTAISMIERLKLWKSSMKRVLCKFSCSLKTATCRMFRYVWGDQTNAVMHRIYWVLAFHSMFLVMLDWCFVTVTLSLVVRTCLLIFSAHYCLFYTLQLCLNIVVVQCCIHNFLCAVALIHLLHHSWMNQPLERINDLFIKTFTSIYW